MLEQLIMHYEEGNKTRFAKRLGISPQGISTWLSRGTIDYELIYAKCENINTDWLLSGEGPMLRNSKNPEEIKWNSTPVTTPISPAEESIIYKMYKDEKEEKERMLKEKDAENKHLQYELREMIAELAALKARQPQSQEKEPVHHPVMDEVAETFTSKPSGDYGEGFSPTKPHTTSKRSSAGKI